VIAAIADDLTGAAEIAGLGWRYGLDAKILHRRQPPVPADLLVYDSDSRHCSPAEAARRVASLARRLRVQSPRWIFKKVDSVLRGNVRAELESAARVLKLHRCILVPANPSGQRIIRRGKYFIAGVPLDQTDFRNDPAHPRGSAQVVELLGRVGRLPVAVSDASRRQLSEGIIVGNAQSAPDLDRWARRIGGDTWAAGGGDFFTALLAQDGHALCATKQRRTPPRFQKTLFVCGSRAASSLRFVATRRRRGWPVFSLPPELLARRGPSAVKPNAWARKIALGFSGHSQVVMTVGATLDPHPAASQWFERVLARAAGEVLVAARPDCVCVEGGSTAAALLEVLKGLSLDVQFEFARGVTGVRVNGGAAPLVVLKPGSYPWPARLRR
jgi:uncharacterized protein YgbK (DUF1537 family)